MGNPSKREVWFEYNNTFSDADSGKKYYLDELLQFQKEGGLVINVESQEVAKAEDLKEWVEFPK